MAHPLNVTLRCEVLATERGVWCHRCNLPSGVSVLLATSGVGYSVMGFTRCLDCHEPCEALA
jgi:hypothetical protein